MTKREAILVDLFFGRTARRTPSGMWRWVNYPKGEKAPTLRDPYVSLLFQVHYVEEKDGNLQLTQVGRIVASKIKL